MQATENNLNTKWLFPSTYFVNPSAVFIIQGYMHFAEILNIVSTFYTSSYITTFQYELEE